VVEEGDEEDGKLVIHYNKTLINHDTAQPVHMIHEEDQGVMSDEEE
jgi:hypothetical protein